MNGGLHVTVDGPPDAPVLLLGTFPGHHGRDVAAAGGGADRALPRGPLRPSRPRRFRGAAGPYTIDLLGRKVLRLLDALGVARVHYAGLSLGGMVGMWLAAHAGERIDRLALLCTSASLGPAEGWRARPPPSGPVGWTASPTR